jgi:putative aminopeptidase FrvX
MQSVGAQESDVEKLSSWVALNAPTGHEHLATGPLSQSLQGWSVDRSGNLLKTTGAGEPRRVVACGLDWNAHAITQITDDGYLRLHGIGRGTGHPLWDQAHEGQHVRILTRSGPLVGVVGVPNGHFGAQHRYETRVVTADDLWLDIGATSAAEVAEMGVQLLDPVLREIPAWSYADEVAGPGAGARAGCAAVVAASEVPAGAGQTTWILSAQRVFGWVGMSGALVRNTPVQNLVLVSPGESTRRYEMLDANNETTGLPVAEYVGLESVQLLAPKVDNPGALMERIKLTEAEALLQAILSAVGAPSDELPAWIAALTPLPPMNSDPMRLAGGSEGARLNEVAAILDRLAETPAVSQHEGPVRAMVLSELPEWAEPHTDELGNVWVEAGPAGEATVFMAHMDEVGYVIESIAADGTVRLDRQGGTVDSSWEGQPARLQLDAGSLAESAASFPELNGVFMTRSAPEVKRPPEVTAWFGMSAAALAEAGVREGMGVTGYKEGHRIGRTRYAARSLDDRGGTTAMLVAINRLDPDALDHRVVFAWSVQEEGGLVGAEALAQRFGASTRRIYSVDTFVSSDTPLESRHFAYAPLGDGPVLRSIENSSMATPKELDRNKSIAEAAALTVQIGLTQGGTDGTRFTYWGAPNAGLSWPGRYSHSPAEVLDLRDLVGLSDLILAMAVAAP